MREVKVTCPGCRSANEVSIEVGPEDNFFTSMHRCFRCDLIFGFDIEVKFFSTTFIPPYTR